MSSWGFVWLFDDLNSLSAKPALFSRRRLFFFFFVSCNYHHGLCIINQEFHGDATFELCDKLSETFFAVYSSQDIYSFTQVISTNGHYVP